VKAIAALSTLVFAAFAMTGCRGPTGPKPLVFTDVTVIDATGVPQKAAMMVVVVGDRITRIEKYERNRVPSGADVVNGEGKFLVPGLWDMHVHWYQERYLPLFIANGVTGVRQMWGTAVLHQWRRRINDTSLLAPRMFIRGSNESATAVQLFRP
jgi:cytosine/adenosine deaminase-related metal-dependent hydrolase